MPNAIDPTLPEPVRHFLAAGARLESIVLDAEGRFFHEGEEVRNPRLRQLFHRSVGRTAGGTWVLQVPPYTYPITVEDTPYHVRSLRWDGDRVLLRLSDDTEEGLDAATLSMKPTPTASLREAASLGPGEAFYCRVKSGAWEARFNRPAYYALAERLETVDGRPALRLSGRVFLLGGDRLG